MCTDIPSRWLHCPRKSDNFIAEKFLAFKTPLSERFNEKMPLDCIFTPEMIFGYMNTLKMKLGLWIDLTNTKRFYNRDVIESKNCTYIKVQCRGHGEAPSLEQTQSFIEIVDSYINNNPNDIIGVHCTHGFNRTGFLIVSYMVEKLDCSVEAALATFAQARPPGIYKEDYLRELFKRYDDEKDAPPPPPLPDWCFEYDDSDGNYQNNGRSESDGMATSSKRYADNENDAYSNNQGNESDDEPSQPKKKRRRFMLKKDAKFMAGVSGVELVSDMTRLRELHKKIQKMCPCDNDGFPGCQPVSMDLTNIQYLSKKPYRVSWKADGTRYMMLINKKNEIYLFDRDFSCFQVENITFPHRTNLHEHIADTLLDGEMVIDKYRGQCIPRYLVYDVITFENTPIGKKHFYKKRLECIRDEIVLPRYEATKKGLIDRNSEPFGVRNKEFWELKQAAYLLGKKFAEKLCHQPDGLIFQPSEEKYVPGVSPEVLKWKPLSMNSVDFRLEIRQINSPGMLPHKVAYLYVGGISTPFGEIKYSKELKELNCKIIECKFENNRWVFMRQRVDKSYPNSYKTAIAVCESIQHPVTTEKLLEYIEYHAFKKKEIKEHEGPSGPERYQ